MNKVSVYTYKFDVSWNNMQVLIIVFDTYILLLNKIH